MKARSSGLNTTFTIAVLGICLAMPGVALAKGGGESHHDHHGGDWGGGHGWGGRDHYIQAYPASNYGECYLEKRQFFDRYRNVFFRYVRVCG